MQIRAYIDYLVDQGYLCVEGTDYPVLHTTQRARQVLFQGERMNYIAKKQDTAGRIPKRKSATPADTSLLALLRIVRTRLASAGDVPAYVVFSNASLEDMAARQPTTMKEFLEVSGVGTVKAERYGDEFLKAIRDWRKENHGTAVILTYRENDYKFAQIICHHKVHYSPNEARMIRGYRMEPFHGTQYQLFCWRDLWFSVYCCYELASIADRSLFQALADLTVAVEWNRDVP